MVIISGIFTDPFGVPMPGVLIQLSARKNASASFAGTNAAAVTADDGSYSMPVLPGVYAVSAKINYAFDSLGVIQVYADSPDATLNQYLTEFNPDDLTPEVLREMMAILAEAKRAAESAWKAAASAWEAEEKAKQYALIPRGEFNPTTVYQKNDLVEYNGSEYLATEDVTGIVPPESPWQLFVAKGTDGTDGTDGEDGPPNTLTVNDVQTLPAGEPATVEISGESPNQSLSFGIPQGKDGTDGKDGSDGQEGESAYQIWLDAGNTGTEADFLASLQGEPGEDGADGQDGPPNTLTIGEVNTAPAGEPAAAEITGDAPDQTLNLTLPQGEEGPAGESAYQIWLDAGNTGTEADFLASLQGGDGQDGADGESAYDIWLDAGNTGTEDDFLASLKGADGKDGADGEPGPPNTLTVGEVSTVPPGTGSSATITGDAPNQVLNLSLEQGEKGEPGEAPTGAVVYKGTWASGTTYVENDLVTATVNGIAGDYICLVESTTASLTDTSAWRRIAGTASAIDGVSADSKGNIAYNRSVDVSTATITPQCNGEQNWILNISASATVDLSTFTNPLYNTNPAAAIKLYIDTSTSGAITVTFTNSDNYWLPDGTYSTNAPVFSLDSTQPMTHIEVTNVTVAGAPGVLVRQVYPVAASGGGGGIVIPELGEPGSTGLFMYINDATAHDPGETFAASALYYAGINDGGNLIQSSGAHPDGGTWQLRGYFQVSTTAKHSASELIRIDGSSLMQPTHLLQATTVSDRIRNCRYSAPDSSMIDCEVLVGGKWYPFTASPTDSTKWGPAIYNAAVAGQFGEVAPYQAPE